MTSHYLNQWRHSLLMHICIPLPQWIKTQDSPAASPFSPHFFASSVAGNICREWMMFVWNFKWHNENGLAIENIWLRSPRQTPEIHRWGTHYLHKNFSQAVLEGCAWAGNIENNSSKPGDTYICISKLYHYWFRKCDTKPLPEPMMTC